MCQFGKDNSPGNLRHPKGTLVWLINKSQVYFSIWKMTNYNEQQSNQKGKDVSTHSKWNQHREVASVQCITWKYYKTCIEFTALYTLFEVHFCEEQIFYIICSFRRVYQQSNYWLSARRIKRTYQSWMLCRTLPLYEHFPSEYFVVL